ncbi:MAG: iron-containing alcohol dehydrogenase [Deltaproteobacteria bacterium]|nr:iron-containing alcohol dehydrogenase [Deltaproteobacteria bacterium]
MEKNTMLKSFQFNSSGRLSFQAGGIQTLGNELKTLGGTKALIVTDQGIKMSGILEKAKKSLLDEKMPFVVFDEVEPNPSTAVVEKGYEVLKKEGCDCLVGLGGGSPIDAAKAIGVQGTNPPPLLQYEGPNKVKNPIYPLVAVPTTAGTGSEVTGASVITDKARKYKCSIRSPYLIPKLAILDPELLTTLPPGVLSTTGMDALTHAYEAFISPVTNPVSQALAYDAMRLIGQNLRRFCANPENIEAAGFMLLASTMAGIAFFNGRVGVVHAMAHPLGGVFNTPHGLANAILLPHCMDFTRLAVPELFGRIAEALGRDVTGLTVNEASKKPAEAVRELMEDLQIPKGLKDVGVKRESFEIMAKDAVNSGIHLTTPRKVTEKDMIELYEKAF